MKTDIQRSDEADIPSIMQFIRGKGRLSKKFPNEHVREKGEPRGILVASKMGKEVYIGWSYTHLTAGDAFDKAKGLEIARNRMVIPSGKQIPRAVLNEIKGFSERSAIYFRVHINDVVLRVSTSAMEKNLPALKKNKLVQQ